MPKRSKHSRSIAEFILNSLRAHIPQGMRKKTIKSSAYLVSYALYGLSWNSNQRKWVLKTYRIPKYLIPVSLLTGKPNVQKSTPEMCNVFLPVGANPVSEKIIISSMIWDIRSMTHEAGLFIRKGRGHKNSWLLSKEISSGAGVRKMPIPRGYFQDAIDARKAVSSNNKNRLAEIFMQAREHGRDIILGTFERLDFYPTLDMPDKVESGMLSIRLLQSFASSIPSSVQKRIRSRCGLDKKWKVIIYGADSKGKKFSEVSKLEVEGSTKKAAIDNLMKKISKVPTYDVGKLEAIMRLSFHPDAVYQAIDVVPSNLITETYFTGVEPMKKLDEGLLYGAAALANLATRAGETVHGVSNMARMATVGVRKRLHNFAKNASNPKVASAARSASKTLGGASRKLRSVVRFAAPAAKLALPAGLALGFVSAYKHAKKNALAKAQQEREQQQQQ